MASSWGVFFVSMAVSVQFEPLAALPGAKLLKSLINRF